MSLLTSTDIANRALQRVGASLIPAGDDSTKTLVDDVSKNADEIRACYDILRRAELRRNVWRFAVRTTALRAISDYTSKLVTFGSWAVGTTYAINDVVTGSDGQVYFSRVATNLAHDPTTSLTYWSLYFGPLSATEYVTTWSATPTYAAGDHAVGSDSLVYTALQTTTNNNPVGDGNVHWSLSTTVDADDPTKATSTSFYAGEIVYIGNKVYLSKGSGNDSAPSVAAKWLPMTTAATVADFNFIYPIGSGPSNQTTSQNAYRLPNGYLCVAPQDRKAGSHTAFGSPTGLVYDDWNFEGDFFTASDVDPILFRFVSDIFDPAAFDPMFVEGFASRIALEICEPLTQSGTKLQAIASEYKQFMSEARMKNGVELGPIEFPEDEYLVVQR